MARRLCRFHIGIFNDGTAPGEDVDVHLHFPDGFKLYDLSNAPRMPIAPRAPDRPKSIGEMMNHSLSHSLRTPQQYNSPDLMGSSFGIRRTNSYDVTDHFKSIKHGDVALLPPMILIFDSVETAQSFQCEYTLRPANYPEAITGSLHFAVEKET